jgi:hypothetical protein
MKKYVFLVMTAVLLIGNQLSADAQNVQGTKVKQHLSIEQIQQKQCNQMVQNLMLDDNTAAKFTPLYLQYLNDMMQCRKMNYKKRTSNGTANSVMTDAEVEKNIENRFAQSRKILEIRENYYNKFRKILSPKQIMRMYQTEKKNADSFKKELNKRRQMRKAKMASNNN